MGYMVKSPHITDEVLEAFSRSMLLHACSIWQEARRVLARKVIGESWRAAACLPSENAGGMCDRSGVRGSAAGICPSGAGTLGKPACGHR